MAQVSSLRRWLGWLILGVALSALAFPAFRPVKTRLIDLKVGTGPAVQNGDKVAVHYVGRLVNGAEFDRSKRRGQPFEVEVGQGRVIPGWDFGLVGMQVGGIRQLEIPPEEAYGARGIPGMVPPNSTLRFEVELIGIR